MSEYFKFDQYSADELRQCGDAFKKHFTATKPTRWTCDVIQWFIDCKANDTLHYCSPKLACEPNGYYEFFVDLCHTTYPQRPPDESYRERLARYRKAVHSELRFRLALESEWGTSSKSENCTVDFLDDATKLAHVRADVKVMIFSSHSKVSKHHDEVVELLTRLRSAALDSTPWLLIDVPCNDGAKTRREIWFDVIATKPDSQ